MSRRPPVNLEQFGQLPMFAQAKTLMHEYHANDATVNHMDKGDLYEHKLVDAFDSPLYEDIERRGVVKPVNIRHEHGQTPNFLGVTRPQGSTVINGHHRVAVQYDVNPDAEVPLNHTDKVMDNESSTSPSEWYGSAGRSQSSRPNIRKLLAAGVLDDSSDSRDRL